MVHASSPLAPLSRFGRPVRALFVDRWGTLLVEPERGYCARPAELAFQPGAVDALFRARRAGWLVYLLGNEEQVAAGKQSAAAWRKVQDAIVAHLAAQGVQLARVYACLDAEGKATQGRDSVFQLPNTGAFYQAAHVDGVSLRDSWVIGDRTLELVAGWRAGLHVGGVRTGAGVCDGTFHVEPAFVARDLAAAVDAVLDAERALAS